MLNSSPASAQTASRSASMLPVRLSPKARSASASARKPSFSILASTAQSGSSIFVKSSSICVSRSFGSTTFSSAATLAAREAISPSRSASVFPSPPERSSMS